MLVFAPLQRGALAQVGLAGLLYQCTHAQVTWLHADHAFRLQRLQCGAQAGGQRLVTLVLQCPVVHRDSALP